MTRWLCLIVVLMLGGCALQPPQPPVPELQLLPLSTGPVGEQLIKQKVTLDKGRAFRFISVLRLDGEALQGAVLLPTGQTLLTYRYTDRLQTKPSEPELPVSEMLALMQFALWPDAALAAYPQSDPGWRLELAPGHRALLWYDRPVVSLEHDAERIRIEQHRKGYSLLIEDL